MQQLDLFWRFVNRISAYFTDKQAESVLQTYRMHLAQGEPEQARVVLLSLWDTYYEKFSHNPSDLTVRDTLAMIWQSISDLPPDGFEFQGVPDPFPDPFLLSHYQTRFRIRKLKAVFLDSLIEQDWQTQCEGKFGGVKPDDRSWKQFYIDNELFIDQCNDPEQLVMWCLKMGHHHYLDFLFENEYSLPEFQADLFPLYWIVENQNPKILKRLIGYGVDVNFQGNGGWTLLHWAARYGASRMTDMLLRAGANPNIKDVRGVTPLYLASFYNHSEVVRLLLRHDACVTVVNKFGTTALHWSVFKGHVDIVAQLLDAAPSGDSTVFNSDFVLMSAMRGFSDILKQFLDLGLSADVRDDLDRSALHWAAQNGHYDCVSLLLQHGADAHQSDRYGFLPMDVAAFMDHGDLLSVLV